MKKLISGIAIMGMVIAASAASAQTNPGGTGATRAGEQQPIAAPPKVPQSTDMPVPRPMPSSGQVGATRPGEQQPIAAPPKVPQSTDMPVPRPMPSSGRVGATRPGEQQPAAGQPK